MNVKPPAHRFCIGFVGGRLQGMETAYLAREADYHVTVIDRSPEAPALALAHEAFVFDVEKEPKRFRQILQDVDAIMPTTEDQQTLYFLEGACKKAGKPFLHDSKAFAISSSKIRSNAFFSDNHIPQAKKWPNCEFPVIVKPARGSGSHGVRVVPDKGTLDTILTQLAQLYGDLVIEAYHEGPSLSLEVIAKQGTGVAYLVTELEFDDRLDCKRVHAPSRRNNGLNHYFEEICLDVARCLDLNGLMDVEVIVDPLEGNLIVLEIDARFPSQTPMAIYHASGINLLEEWVKTHVMGQTLYPKVPEPGCAWLEHVDVRDNRLEFIGETRLLPWNRIRVWPNGSFFGATVALTDYQEGKKSFKATLIFADANWPAVFEMRQECLERMASSMSLKGIVDPVYRTPQN